MPTLYVENVPDELYEALKSQARLHRRSIAQEAISLLEQYVPTAAELKKRSQFLEKALAMRSVSPSSPGPFESAEEMLAQDRSR